MLINLERESKLHAWLLQGMIKTGRSHWKECADYYKHHTNQQSPRYMRKRTQIKFDQYVKAINHIGTVPRYARTVIGCNSSGAYI